MAWDPHERDSQVLGQRERLSCLPPDALDDRHFAAMERLRLLYGHPDAPTLASFFANLAHSPEFFASYVDLGVAVSTTSALPLRLRELAILRTAWLYGAPYVWGEHVHAGHERVFAAGEVERITQGAGADGWSDLEQAVLRAVEDLHAEAIIADDTWDALAEHLDERQLLELPVIIGHYVMTAFLQNSLRTRLTAHNQGLAAR